MKEIILHNQSILDLAIQHTGSVENAFAISVANGISVSDLLEPGMSLEIPESLAKNTDILNYYMAKKMKPATGTTAAQNAEIPTLKGIGYMKISGNFIVS